MVRKSARRFATHSTQRERVPLQGTRAALWLALCFGFAACSQLQSSGAVAQEVATTDPRVAAWQSALSATVAGQTVFSRHDRTEYQSGNLPLIIAAPHGGRLSPSDLPNRTEGVLSSDTNVDRLAQAVSSAIRESLAQEPSEPKNNAAPANDGRSPHLVLCHLHRRKLDANRPLDAACDPDSPAQLNWHEYQVAIEHAKQVITLWEQRGLFVELHGHAHPIQRLELGYLLRSQDFELPKASFNDLGPRCSLREIASRGQVDVDQLLRGTASLGHMLAEQKLDSVPSPEYRSPGREPYFNGGWNTLQHGSRDKGTISSLQIECHYRGVRDSTKSINEAAASLGRALVSFLKLHYPSAQ